MSYKYNTIWNIENINTNSSQSSLQYFIEN